MPMVAMKNHPGLISVRDDFLNTYERLLAGEITKEIGILMVFMI